MALIKIETLAACAKALGFRVHGGAHYAEIFEPAHQGPDAVYSGDSLYSCCDHVLSDRPGTGYGYNECFYGPWHDGMVQSDDYATIKLLKALDAAVQS